MGFKYFCQLLQTMLLFVCSVSSIHKRSDDNPVAALENLGQQQAVAIQTLQAQLTRLENRFTAQQNIKVSFTAQLSPASYTTVANSPIRFDQVVTNAGSAYNPVTGHFTAPVTGTYVFYAQLMNFQHSPSTHWGLVDSTGSTLCRTYLTTETLFDKASCLATYRLTVGQSVFVVNQDRSSSTEEGNNISSFSGFLLFAD